MKLRGEFVVRQVMDEILAVPVGQTALEFNGMILLNDVSKVIWDCLAHDTELDAMVTAITEKFEVSDQTAREDILAFLDSLRQTGLLSE